MAVVSFQIVVAYDVQHRVCNADVRNAHSHDELGALRAFQEIVHLEIRRLRGSVFTVHPDHSPVLGPVKSDILILLAWKRSVQIVHRSLFFRGDVGILVCYVLTVNSRIDHDRSDEIVRDCLVYVRPLRAAGDSPDLTGLIQFSADDGFASVDAYGLVAVGDDTAHELVYLIFGCQPHVEGR